jgi:uncharacterized protein YjbI with pentapeptide repeats
MADPEHLDLLREGVEVWNRWRAENWLVKPDLSNGNLRNADLQEINLHEADLRLADLQGINLCRVDMRQAHLRGVNLSA